MLRLCIICACLGLLGSPAWAEDLWARADAGGGLLVGLVHRAGGDAERMLGAAVTFDAVFAMVDPADRWHAIFGVTGGVAPGPTVAGRSLDATLTWGGPGGGVRWLLGSRWTLDAGMYLVRAAADMRDRPNRATGLSPLLRMRAGYAWPMSAGALSAGAAVSWFRAADDESDAFTTDHGVLSLCVAWAIGGAR